jgi:gluconolactonase
LLFLFLAGCSGSSGGHRADGGASPGGPAGGEEATAGRFAPGAGGAGGVGVVAGGSGGAGGSRPVGGTGGQGSGTTPDAGVSVTADAGVKDAGAASDRLFSWDVVTPDFRGVPPTFGPVTAADQGTSGEFDNTCAVTWNTATSELLVTVCQINHIWRWRPGVAVNGGWDIVRRGGIQTDDTRGMAIFGGAFIVAEAGSRRITRSVMGYDHPTTVVDHWPGGDGTPAGRFNRPYHVVARRDGNTYFTDSTTSNTTHTNELPFSGIYRIDPAGNLTLLVRDGWPTKDTAPHGLAFSLDQSTLYVSTGYIGGTQGIYKFPVYQDGTLGPRSLFVPRDQAGSTAGAGGLCTDQAGNVYYAKVGVKVFSPEGKLIATIPVPRPNDCAFGEADLKTLFVTNDSDVGARNLYRVKASIPGTPESF